MAVELAKNVTDKLSEERIQCHFVSNTHWDREWRYSAQRTRYMLVYMLDMLFDIFAKEPDFKYFHLDSQTLPLQDYLEVRPEKEDLVRQYVSEGRLQIGPWFCLPDEFCVGGESLVRNLLLGHKIARRFGQVSKTGYSPFSWGQISQMPQIYRGFGIDVMSFYRGINTLVAPRSEFIWEGPDGTRIIASRLGARPRYNVWYVIQRPVYWNEADENNRVMSWRRGHGPFRFIDLAKCELDYQYVHPEFGYHAENIPARAEQALREQDNDWTTPHRFWSAGHDSSCPDIREARLIQDCQKALAGRADVFHSTIAALQDGIRANQRPDWPVVRGEMRHPYTKGSTSGLMGWIISARIRLKQDNFQTERELTAYTEPLAVFASLLGAPYPQSFIDLAYNWLLQNHGHDSIGGCGRDIVAEDVLYRSRQAREICNCVLERAMMDIAGSINLSCWPADEMALVVYNPAPFARSEVLPAVIEIPQEWGCDGFAVTDDEGREVPVQIVDRPIPYYQVVQNPNDVANTYPSKRFQIRAAFADVPGMGYRTYRVTPRPRAPFAQPKTMLTGPQTMENEFLAVTIKNNGTLAVKDRVTGRSYDRLGYFRDASEIGNPWEHKTVANETVYTTLNEKAEVTLVRDGELEASFRVTLNWALPEGRAADDRTRSSHLRPYRIVNTVTLRQGQPWVEIVTEIDNTVEDHYLQVSFPTGIAADKVEVQGQFDVLERPIAKPDYAIYDEVPMTEHPMNSFVSIGDGQTGVALLNEGLKAYAVDDNADRTISLTLLRCFPLRICVTHEMIDYSHLDKGSQCPGRHVFRYGFMPHRGDWIAGGVWQASERFNLSFHAAQVGPTGHGTEPRQKSFLELRPENLHLSAVKRSESGEGWVVRIFNPYAETVHGSIRFNGGWTGPCVIQSPVERVKAEYALPVGRGGRWRKVRATTLEEVPEEELVMDAAGWVGIQIGAKKILTLEFLP
ncbi:MAG: alpha-mannosidase [Bacteroidota bacterium]